MGIREWGVYVKHNGHIRALIRLVKRHNIETFIMHDDMHGEKLVITSIVKSNESGEYYVVLHTLGGGESISKFLGRNWHKTRILWPFEKPEWWLDEEKETHVWINSNQNDNIKFFNNHFG